MADQKALEKRESAMAHLQSVGAQIDEIVQESLPMTMKAAANFVEGLSIAKAIADLRSIFLNNQDIARVVMHMTNNRLGFLTDRPNKKNPKPYDYKQLVNPIVEGLLKGYRITGNELNIIAGQFYAAKAGSFRRIVEWPNLVNFRYGNAPVQWPKQGGVYARVKTWATWQINNKEFSVGVSDDDDATFQIRINAMMGEDALVGKAHSKLFKRVLERLSGQVMPEFTDIEPGDIADAQYISEPIPDEVEGQDAGMDMYAGSEEGPPGDEPPPFEDGAETMGVPSQEVADDQEAAEELTEDDELPEVVNELCERLAEDYPLYEDSIKIAGTLADEKNITLEDFAQHCKAFPEVYKVLCHHIEGMIPDDEEPKTETPPENEPQIMRLPMGDPAWWDDLKNWVNRRSTPFLYLVRVGLGLPHQDQIITRPGDQELPKVAMDAQAAWQKEVDDNPKAYGALLGAHPEAIKRVKNKIRGMGYDPDLWARWVNELNPKEEAQEDVGQTAPPSGPPKTHMFNGTQIGPLPQGISEGTVARWQRAIEKWPNDLVYVIREEGFPTDEKEAREILSSLQAILEQDARHGNQKF